MKIEIPNISIHPVSLEVLDWQNKLLDNRKLKRANQK